MNLQFPDTDVYMEMTPNPSALKFVLNRLVTTTQAVEFERADVGNGKDNLIRQLFQFPFVQRIYACENYLSITRTEQIEWFEVQNELRSFIKAYFQKNQWAFTIEDFQTAPKTAENLEAKRLQFTPTDYDAKIVALLEEYVRPNVQADGGEILFIGLKDKTVYVQLSGACLGCPSSNVTLKNGIQNLLQNMLPGVVKDVVAL